MSKVMCRICYNKIPIYRIKSFITCSIYVCNNCKKHCDIFYED